MKDLVRGRFVPFSGRLPNPEAAREGIRVITGPAAGRQLDEVVDVPSPENHVIRFEGRDQARHDVVDGFSPFRGCPAVNSSVQYPVRL